MKLFGLMTGCIALFAASLPFASEAIPEPLQGYQEELVLHVEDGYVNYRAWSEDRDGLDRFVDSLKEADLNAFSQNEKKALLINAYNACMIWIILKHYPLKSVFDIEPKPFKQEIFNLGGKLVSLDFIEHEQLRKMGDPRIHFAIVCASIGCPDLNTQVYQAENLDEQLEGAARRYFSQKKGLRVQAGPPRVYLSMLFDWFGEDFGENKRERLQFAARFAPLKWRKFLRNKAKKISIDYIEYDWSLNSR